MPSITPWTIVAIVGDGHTIQTNGIVVVCSPCATASTMICTNSRVLLLARKAPQLKSGIATDTAFTLLAAANAAPTALWRSASPVLEVHLR